MARKMNLDFTGVESFNRASEGEHVCKVSSADVKQSQGGNDMIVVAFEVTKGDDKGARVYENYPLVDNALWKLKGLLQAIGMKADGKVSLDLDKLVGKVLTVIVKHEEYDGKIRARVDEVKKFSVATSDDEEEDEAVEEEAPKKEKPSKKAPMNPPKDEDDDDDWDDEEEEPAPKKKKAEAKPEKKATKKVEVEDDDDDWDDEEDDEPAPKKASKPEKKAPEKKATKKAEDDDDDWDDDDWDE